MKGDLRHGAAVDLQPAKKNTSLRERGEPLPSWRGRTDRLRNDVFLDRKKGLIKERGRVKVAAYRIGTKKSFHSGQERWGGPGISGETQMEGGDASAENLAPSLSEMGQWLEKNLACIMRNKEVYRQRS